MEVTMKKLLVILFVVLAGLFLFSCKSSTSPEDFDLVMEKDIIAIFSNYFEFEETFALVSVEESIASDVSLSVNGVAGDLYYSHPSEDGRMNYFFDVAYVEFGKSFNYVVKVGNEQYSGSIKHPDKYEPSFPDFDYNKDYTFNWSLASNPQYQFVDYYLGGPSAGDWLEVEEDVDLKPSARKHTIKKSVWGVLDSVSYIDVSLLAYNAKKHGSQCSVVAYSDAFYDAENWDKMKTHEGKLPKGAELILNRLNK